MPVPNAASERFFAVSTYGGLDGYRTFFMRGKSHRENGFCHVVRTGPFIPPIVAYGDSVIVSAAFRDLLDRSSLGPFEYAPVVKETIVDFDWQHWLEKEFNPRIGPSIDGVYQMLMRKGHSPEAAAKMGDLWELVLPNAAAVEHYRPHVTWTSWDGVVIVNRSSWDGRHFLRGPHSFHFIVDQTARAWLEVHAGEWIRFDEVIYEHPGDVEYWVIERGSTCHFAASPQTIREALQRLSMNPKLPGSVKVVHRTDMCLSMFANRRVSLWNHDSRNGGPTWLLDNVDRDLALKLAILACNGDFDQLMTYPWVEQRSSFRRP